MGAPLTGQETLRGVSSLSYLIGASWRRRLALFIVLTSLLFTNASIKESSDRLADSIHNLTESLTGYAVIPGMREDLIRRIPGVKAVHELTFVLTDNITAIYVKEVPEPLLPVDKIPRSGECLASSDLLERFNLSLNSWLNLSSFRCRVVGAFQGWALPKGDLITGFPISGVRHVEHVLEIKVKGSREVLKKLSGLTSGTLIYLGPSEDLIKGMVKRKGVVDTIFTISLAMSALGVAIIRWLEVSRDLKQVGLLISQGVSWSTVLLQEVVTSSLVAFLSFITFRVDLIVFSPLAAAFVGSAVLTLWAVRDKSLGKLL